VTGSKRIWWRNL